MKLFDTHAHYDDKKFDGDRDALLRSLPGKDIEYVCNVGSSMRSSQQSVDLAEQYPFVYASCGVHPHEAKSMWDDDYSKLCEMLCNVRVRALGEIGLDYHYDFSPRDVQKQCFYEQMKIARDMGMPVIIHEREAFSDCFEIVKRFPDVTGVFHCFSGSAESAKELVKLGYMLSFTGVITFKNARRSHEAIQAVPHDRIMIETDAPYLAPEPYRGQRCDSTMLHSTIRTMAECMGVSPEEAAFITTQNALRFYKIR